jgi:TolB-like protein/Tfp pilus assembly protein PilF
MEGESPTQASIPAGAAFLSYASQDAEAAKRICEALRAGGIEVWFDQSELRGGDVWDQKIRREIHDCALFVPVISANTASRHEGYFRLEWDLAEQRSHMIARSRVFVVPVCLDATTEAAADVPESFKRVQWTRLPRGDTPPAFLERMRRLLSREATHASAEARPRAAAVPHAAAAPLQPASSPTTSPQTHWVPLMIAAVVVIGLGYFAVDKFVLSKHEQGTKQAPAQPAQAITQVQIPEKSIAVLPFVDMSEKHDQEYFSDGLAEELLDLLSQVPDLRVPARTSSFYFKGRSDDIATIAGKLRVAHLLEGSVRRSGKRIRVTAQLIRADNGYHLWSKTYDRDVSDIFQVQDEIASAVVSALKAQLLSSQPLASRHRTDNTEAYAQYLLGNQLRERDTRESNRQALEAYRRAVALDPGYAAAYSGVAEAEWRIVDLATGEAAGAQRSRAAAEHAIALAPDSPDGYWARGVLRGVYDFDWTGAESDFKKALELDPNDVRVLRDYGGLFATRGRNAEALAAMHRSLALDPLSVRAWRQLGSLQLDLGRLTEAKEAGQHLTVLAPESYLTIMLVGNIALAEGRAADALAEFRKDSGIWKLIGSAMAEYTLGDAAASQAALEQLVREYAVTSAYQIAEVYAWRGERDAAFAWLERAYRQHDGGMTYLYHSRLFAPLRDDPRYQALLHKLNLF